MRRGNGREWAPEKGNWEAENEEEDTEAMEE